MKVLMLGWEFPPYKSGGLGTACYDLTKGLSHEGIDVTFVMPFAPKKTEAEFVKLIGANSVIQNIKVRTINSILTPYMTESDYLCAVKGGSSGELYGKNMAIELARYEKAVEQIVKEEDFDLVHAHDWMTYEAGMKARTLSGKPLVVHLHATEGDRTAGNPNPWIAAKEQSGLTNADYIIANSHWTKNNILREYGVRDDKIGVVHWGISQDNPAYDIAYKSPLQKRDKIVLSLGRITIQKGIDYLVAAASTVVKHVPNVKFVIVGKGDKLGDIIHQVSELGLSEKFIFPGWLKGDEVHKAFQMADVFVMPSVSEPFGLVALESLKNGTPIIISKQSGASEVVQHSLKIDFWDTRALADKLVGILKHDSLRTELAKHSYEEAKTFDLLTPARKCIDIYKQVLEVSA